MLQIAGCTGCTACAEICPANCIEMTENEKGFLYPTIDLSKCKNCGMCEKVCPVMRSSSPGYVSEGMPEAFAAFNVNGRDRINSSSGGVFSALAEEIINQNGVVYGAAFTEDLAVHHIAVTDKKQISLLRGSKYVQSYIGDCYKDAKKNLIEGKKVLFSGTPCQIEGLLSYLSKPYENLFTVDIVCHGVPSPLAWEKYLRYMERQYQSNIKHVSFRDKEKGWKNFSMKIVFDNGMEYVCPHDDDLYMKAFLKNLCLRDSCYQCKFKSVRRHSDLTIADLWGIESIAPQIDDDKGVSLVFIQSEKGKQLFENISESLSVVKIDSELAAKKNGAMNQSAWKDSFSDYFFHFLRTTDFEKLVRECDSPSYFVRLKRKLLVR